MEIPVNKYLEDIIIKNNLFLSGHYEVNPDVSARDWIDLESLFKQNKFNFINPITECLVNEIKTKENFYENSCILGINYYGAILAAIIGFKHNLPFSYYFDRNKIIDISENEIQINDRHKCLFIIVDVVVYGNTVVDVINELISKKIIDNSVSINLIILYERKINETFLSRIYLSEYIKKIYVLNDSFNIEICSKNRSNCIFRNNETMNKYNKHAE